MVIKSIIFDLDDTLYYEMEYVKSGFKAVSKYISQKYGLDFYSFYEKLLKILENKGRGQIFDIALKHFGLPLAEVKKMLEVYRTHKPDKLHLYDDAEFILDKYSKKKNYKLGIITDGISQVQWNKIKSLGLQSKIDKIIVSDDFGFDKRKPNPFVYKKMLDLLKVKPEEAVYVGDDPSKDFVTARKLGIKTIRIIREHGLHVDKIMRPEYEADFKIYKLTELDDILNQY